MNNKRFLKEYKVVENAPSSYLFSQYSTDLNHSNLLSFQSLQLHPSLIEIVDHVLSENPGWKAQLARIEYVKATSASLTDESKFNLDSSFALRKGKEKKLESNFKVQKIPEFKLNTTSSWEIDLWGKWIAYSEEANQLIMSEIHIKEGAKLSLIYEIARLWYQYAFLKEDLVKLTNQIRNHHESHIYHVYKYHAGLDDNESILLMENEINLLALEHSKITRMLSLYEIQLQTYTKSPLDFNISNISDIQIPEAGSVFPTNSLEGRPDILKGKAELLAQAHHTHASALNLYPSLSLNLSGITMTGDLSNPFEQWSISGGPIFDIPLWSPKRKSQFKAQQELLKVMELQWKQTIINAVKEIESSLISHQALLEDYKLTLNIQKKLQNILKIKEIEYRSGLLAKSDILDIKNHFILATRKVNKAKFQCIFSFLELSKNLGINWI